MTSSVLGRTLAPMPTTQRLPLLHQYLQHHWDEQSPIPLQLNCGLRQNRLLVLAEHEAHYSVEPQQVFPRLQAILLGLPAHLRSLLPQVSRGDGRIGVAFYLRAEGQRTTQASELWFFPAEAPKAPGTRTEAVPFVRFDGDASLPEPASQESLIPDPPDLECSIQAPPTAEPSVQEPIDSTSLTSDSLAAEPLAAEPSVANFSQWLMVSPGARPRSTKPRTAGLPSSTRPQCQPGSPGDAPGDASGDGVSEENRLGRLGTEPALALENVRVVRDDDTVASWAETGLGVETEPEPGEAGFEIEVEPGFDAGSDTDGEIEVEIGFDAVAKAGIEAGIKTGIETGIETGFGAGIETGFGAGIETGFGAGIETGFGAGIETGFGAGIETGFGAGVEAGVEAEAETGWEAELLGSLETELKAEPGSELDATDGEVNAGEEALPPLLIPRAAWIGGIVLAIGMFGGSFYLASRPCVWGDCQPLVVAQQKQADIQKVLQGANTWEDLERAKRQLEHSNRLLGQVPFWTSSGPAARQLVRRNQTLLTALAPIQVALKLGAQATDHSQGQVLGEAQLRQVQTSWEAAIAQLQGIPSQNPLYPLVQDKLRQYQSNRDNIEAQIRQEKEGQRLLAEAKRVVSVGQATSQPAAAPTSEGIAALQSTYERLSEAVNLLKQVPKGTTAHLEAQSLLTSYRNQLNITATEQEQERITLEHYRTGIALADQARLAENKKSWTDARDYWRSATEHLLQIPPDNPYYSDAQSRLVEYNQALNQAQAQAQRTSAMTQAETELKSICAGVPTVCTYKVEAELIAVQLTLDYERAVLTAGTLGDAQNREEALRHVKSLETALESTSNNTGIPLQVFDPDGTLVGSHNPPAL